MARARSAPDIDDSTLWFMQDLWALGHGLEVASRRMLEQLGVTGPQRLVLRVVGERPGITPGEIASTLALHPSTLTGIVRRLERERFLVRAADPRDGRRVRCRLTPRGRKVSAARRGTVEAAVRRTLERTSAASIATAAEVMQRLATELLDGDR